MEQKLAETQFLRLRRHNLALSIVVCLSVAVACFRIIVNGEIVAESLRCKLVPSDEHIYYASQEDRHGQNAANVTKSFD